MKKPMTIRWIQLLLALAGCAAQAGEVYEGTCNVAFKGDSTLHAFAGDVTNVALKVMLEPDASGQPSLSTRVDLGVKALSTHHTKRDANMQKMFQSDQHPSMLVTVSNAPLSEARLTPEAVAKGPGMLPLRMTIAGVACNYKAATKNQKPMADGWEFDLEYDVSLKDMKLKPPTALLGTVKVRDTVHVTAHVKVKRR
jgi:hypothetical protein